MKTLALLLTTALALQAHASAQTPCCGPITPAGDHLSQTLDGMHVESLWLADQHINWETGEPDRGAGYEGPGNHTHCSAFAAAAAKRFGVYLLRPPEHSQELLSNAQVEWMTTPEAAKDGWHAVPDMHQAQHLANQGHLVIVLIANPDKHAPGHVAIVRPSTRSAAELNADGPETIQAANHNYNKTSVRKGFAHHPGAWPNGVHYYEHPLN